MPDTLTLRRPDDWHVHLRDGALLAGTLEHTARQFGRAIVMPNLAPPVIRGADAEAYLARIRAALPAGNRFTPLMTLYLSDGTDPDDLEAAFKSGLVTAAKLYPAHATTNSAHGVTSIEAIARVLERMARIGMPLLVHGEVTSPDVDIFDREAVFIDQVMLPMLSRHEGLRVVFEHITTADAADFVARGPETLAATITPHHLMINRNALFAGGLRPHAYCLPVAKRETHRLALRRAATSGSDRFFLGTDTAPHYVEAKESACGCAGIFNAPYALEAYATVFDEEGALDRLEHFASLAGPKFYGLAPNEERVTLERAPTEVPERVALGTGEIVPFLAGETIGWRFVGAA